MLEDHPIILAALTGFISGLLVSIPVGPVNLTVIKEGARRGFVWAVMIGLGAVTMEMIYCAVAFTGFASFFQRGLVKAAMELISFVFMLFLGVKFLTARAIESVNKIEERIEERLHPRSAFAVGFVRVMANPGVLLLWSVLAAKFISHEWVDTDVRGTRLACVIGVVGGAGLWFASLSYYVSLRHQTISEKALLRMEQFSGIFLLLLALYDGGKIIWQMARHKM